MNYGQFCEKHKGDQMDICRMICEYAEAAYKAGYEEGVHNGREEAWKCAKQIVNIDKSCNSCKFEDKDIGEEPCKNCKCSYVDMWEAKR